MCALALFSASEAFEGKTVRVGRHAHTAFRTRAEHSAAISCSFFLSIVIKGMYEKKTESGCSIIIISGGEHEKRARRTAFRCWRNMCRFIMWVGQRRKAENRARARGRGRKSSAATAVTAPTVQHTHAATHIVVQRKSYCVPRDKVEMRQSFASARTVASIHSLFGCPPENLIHFSLFASSAATRKTFSPYASRKGYRCPAHTPHARARSCNDASPR